MSKGCIIAWRGRFCAAKAGGRWKAGRHRCNGTSQVNTSDREPVCQCRRRECDPWVGKVPWRREWQPIPVLLPGESHGQTSLTGYSPRDWRVGHENELARMHSCNQNVFLSMFLWGTWESFLRKWNLSELYGMGKIWIG